MSFVTASVALQPIFVGKLYLISGTRWRHIDTPSPSLPIRLAIDRYVSDLSIPMMWPVTSVYISCFSRKLHSAVMWSAARCWPWPSPSRWYRLIITSFKFPATNNTNNFSWLIPIWTEMRVHFHPVSIILSFGGFHYLIQSSLDYWWVIMNCLR